MGILLPHTVHGPSRSLIVTYRRIAKQTFIADQNVLAEYTLEVLKARDKYRNVREGRQSSGTTFTTNIKPNILLLGVDMRVTLERIEASTLATATIISQPWIIGDAFGFYDRYLESFISDLDDALSTEIGPQVISDNAVYSGGADWISTLITITLLALLLFFYLAINPIISNGHLIILWVLLPAGLLLLAAFARLLNNLRSR